MTILPPNLSQDRTIPIVDSSFEKRRYISSAQKQRNLKIWARRAMIGASQIGSPKVKSQMLVKKFKRPSVRLRVTQELRFKGREVALTPPESECTGGRLSLRRSGARKVASWLPLFLAN
jgi:hypothetical protein